MYIRNQLKEIHLKSPSELIGIIYLIITSIHIGLSYTQLELFNSDEKIAIIVEASIFVLYLFYSKFDIRTFFKIVILMTIAVINYITSDSVQMILLCMSAIIFVNVSYSNGLKTIFWVRLVETIIIILLSIAGILDIYKIIVPKYAGLTVGYGLGFSHPNRLAFNFEYLILLVYCIKNKSINNVNRLCSVVTTLIVFYITKSRTFLYSISLFIIIEFIYSKTKNKNIFNKIITILGNITMPICAAISILIPKFLFSASGFIGDLLKWINGLMSLRFTYIYRVFLYYPVTLFGGTNDFSKLNKLFDSSVVDNGYINLLYRFGIIGFLLFIILTMICTAKLSKKHEYIYLLSTFIVSLWGVSENILISFAFDLIIVFWSEDLKSTYKSNSYNILRNTSKIYKY